MATLTGLTARGDVTLHHNGFGLSRGDQLVKIWELAGQSTHANTPLCDCMADGR